MVILKPSLFKIFCTVTLIFKVAFKFLNLGVNETSNTKLNWIFRKRDSNGWRSTETFFFFISMPGGEPYFAFQPHYTSIHKAWYKNFKPQMF